MTGRAILLGLKAIGVKPGMKLMERAGLQVKRRIGKCLAVFFRLQDFLESAWRLLDNGHGGFPP